MVSRRLLLTLVLVLMTCWVLASSCQPARAQVAPPANPELLIQLEGIGDIVNSIAYSPDGRSLAVGLFSVKDKGLVLRLATGEITARMHPEVRFTVEPLSTDLFGNLDAPIVDTGNGYGILSLAPDYEFTSVALSPDGRVLAAGGLRNHITFWDTATGASLGQFTGHEGKVLSVAFNSTGSLASGGEDGLVLLWDFLSGLPNQVLGGHTKRVTSGALSPDASRVAAGSWANTLRIWDAASGACLQTFTHTHGVEAVAFSPNGKYVASGDWSVHLWDAETGALVRDIGEHDGSAISSLAFSPDGTLLACGSRDTARIWNVESGQLLYTFTGHTASVNSISFSPDGKQVATGSSDETVRVWDISSGILLRIYEEHKTRIDSLAVSVDGRQLALGGWPVSAQVVDLATGQPLNLAATSYGMYADGSVALSKDGRQVLYNSGNTACLCDVHTGQLLRRFEGHKETVRRVALSPDESQIATGSDDKSIKLWKASTGELLRSLKGHGDPIKGLVYSPDGTRLASISYDRTLRVWDVETGKNLKVIKTGSKLVYDAFAWSPDGKALATCIYDGPIQLYDAQTGACLKTISLEDTGLTSPHSLAFSPDSKWILSGHYKMIGIWDMATGRLLKKLEGHTGLVYAVAFTPDGKRFLSADGEGAVRIWEAATGRYLATFHMLSGEHLDSDAWLVTTPEGYYDGSPDALKLISWRVGEEVFPEETYHDRFYRPDLVQKALAGESLASPAGG